MAKPTGTKWPKLAAAFDAYGLKVKFADLWAMKTSRNAYAVLAWLDANGMVCMADFARSVDSPWQCQNDGFELITQAQWRLLRIIPECDSFQCPKSK